MKVHGKRWVLGVFALLASCQVLLVVSYFHDQHTLAERLNSVAAAGLPPSEVTLRALELLKDLPSIDSNEQYFLLPAFHFLRATPRQILRDGGDCADRSRLLIALLHTRNIFASKWALYSKDLRPAHSVIEVHTELGRMVVDPLFGLWFPRPGGGYYSIEDLRRDPGLLYARVRYQQSQQLQTGGANIDRYPLQVYFYGLARTINWDKSAAEHFCYRILHALIGSNADYIPRPIWVEQPSLIAFAMIIVLELLLVVVVLLAKLRSRHLASRGLRVTPTAVHTPGLRQSL
jgi:hypothetical protein